MRAGAAQSALEKAPSPSRAVLLTVISIFATEATIMLVLPRLPPLSAVAAALLDPALLCAITLPVVYGAWFRPLARQVFLRDRAALELEAQAQTDALTGLPNRVGFLAAVRKELHHAARVQGSFSVVVVDLRRFGEVNGALGHESGDSLLKLIAERLRSNAGTLGSAARLGSDLFGIVLAGVDLQRASEAVERLLALVEVPFLLSDATFEVEAHVGYASYPQHGDTPQVLVQRAELAVKRAKKQGDRTAGYREENEAQVRRRLMIARLLRKGIERGELSLVYQPKVCLNAGEFAGVEALVRWTEPGLGVISPAEFVPLAEQTNLIRPLTLWVLEEAVRQMAAWKSGGLDVNVAVNLSARNLVDESIPERVSELLAEWGVEASRLTIEVTESAVLSEPERTARVLERFRALGVNLSIDDFGTGYSSLTYVRTMPASELKIDRSFTHGLDVNEGNAAIVRAVVGLAHSLGMQVVCEGVETDEVLRRLREFGCDYVQGFYVSAPLSAPALASFVADSLLRPFAAAAPRQRAPKLPSVSGLAVLSRPPLRESLRAIRIASVP